MSDIMGCNEIVTTCNNNIGVKKMHGKYVYNLGFTLYFHHLEMICDWKLNVESVRILNEETLFVVMNICKHG